MAAQSVHRTTADEPEQTGCHEGPTIHFDRPPGGSPTPRFNRPLGLSQLLYFVAKETGLGVGPLLCHSTYAVLDTGARRP
jgi:hypothetical protein